MNECSICYLPEDKCEGIIKTKCKHFSCLPCFIKWNKMNDIATCPECRTPYINNEKIINIDDLINSDQSFNSDNSTNSSDIIDSDSDEIYVRSIPMSIKIYIGSDFYCDYGIGLNKIIELSLMLKFKENGLINFDTNNNITFVLDEFASTIFNKPIGYEIKYENFSNFINEL
jgi:hypothetical protein